MTEETLRMLIRATARTSAICVAFAFAGIRVRTFLALLPVSHGLHFAAILALALTTSFANAHISVTSIGGMAIFALMVSTAFRPTTWAIYALWMIFIVGFGIRDMTQPVYPAVMAMLIAAAVVRASRAMRQRRTFSSS
jgi:hypothetical protein